MPKAETLYILSNKAGLYGAAAVLYDGVLKDLAEKIENDLLILPSSIHETLLIPYENSLVISDMADYGTAYQSDRSFEKGSAVGSCISLQQGDGNGLNSIIGDIKGPS